MTFALPDVWRHTTDCGSTKGVHDDESTTVRLGLALLLAAAVSLLALVRGADPAQSGTGEVILLNEKWVCDEAVDLALVRVVMTTEEDDAISLANGCTGNIDRIEVVTYTEDGVKVQNATAGVATDLEIGSGYIYCLDHSDGSHQDGIQAMGGLRITFSDLRIACGDSSSTSGDGPNSQLFIAQGGQGANKPDGIVCDGCELGPYAAHTVLQTNSDNSGVSNSYYCPDRTPFGGWFDIGSGGGVTNPVNSGNTQFSTETCGAFAP